MTPKTFADNKLVVASHNPGKIREIRELLAPYHIEVLGGIDFNLAEPEEHAESFKGNAQIKSRYFARHTGLPSLSDDSGLVIPALNGEPGIHSARWAGKNKDFKTAMRRIESELMEKTGKAEDQPAHFVCVLSLSKPDGRAKSFEGKVFGTLTFPPRGEKGFGYDPIFVPEGYHITFGEMESAEKHAISHRARAFRKFVDACFKPSP